MISIIDVASHPLALTGVGLWLLIGLLKAIVSKGIIPPLTKSQGAVAISTIIRLVFVLGLLLIGLAFYAVHSNTDPRAAGMDPANLAAEVSTELERRGLLLVPTEQAEAIIVETLDLLSQIGDQSEFSISIDNLLQGEIEVAERLLALQFNKERLNGEAHFERAAEYAFALGSLKSLISVDEAIFHFQMANTLNPEEQEYTDALARALWSAGRIEESISFFTELAQDQKNSTNEWDQIRGLMTLTWAAIEKLELDEAEVHNCKALEMLAEKAKECELPEVSFDPETCELKYDRSAERHQSSITELTAQVEFARQTGNDFAVARYLLQLGRLHNEDERRHEAEDMLQTAMQIARDKNFLSLLPDIYFEQTKALVRNHQLEPSLRYGRALYAVRSGIHAARNYGSDTSVIYGQSLAGWVHLSFGQTERGILLYERARDKADVIGLVRYKEDLSLAISREALNKSRF